MPIAEVKKLNKIKERANINAFKTLKIQDENRKKVKNETNTLMTQCNYYSVQKRRLQTSFANEVYDKMNVYIRLLTITFNIKSCNTNSIYHAHGPRGHKSSTFTKYLDVTCAVKIMSALASVHHFIVSS